MDSPDLLREFTPIDLDQPTPDHLRIGCSDYRFGDAFRQILLNRGVGSYDLLDRPGPSVNIAKGNASEDMTDLDSLHNLSYAHVMDHIPCRKFIVEGLYTPDMDQDEIVEIIKQKQDRACRVVHEVLPHITVVTYIVNAEEVVSERVMEGSVVQAS